MSKSVHTSHKRISKARKAWSMVNITDYNLIIEAPNPVRRDAHKSAL